MEKGNEGIPALLVQGRDILQMREKQLKDVAVVLSETNEKYLQALAKRRAQEEQLKELQKKIVYKKKQIAQERYDKSVILHKLETCKKSLDDVLSNHFSFLSSEVKDRVPSSSKRCLVFRLPKPAPHQPLAPSRKPGSDTKRPPN